MPETGTFVLALLAALGLMSVTASCGGNGRNQRAAPPSTSVAPDSSAILAAYRAHWADINAVSSHPPVDATSPQLSEHMAGQELGQVQARLALLAVRHEYVVGPPVDTSMAEVKAVLGTAAVVTDCDLDQGVRKNESTGVVVNQASSQRTLVNARLDLIGGSWKVTQFSVVHPGCVSANS